MKKINKNIRFLAVISVFSVLLAPIQAFAFFSILSDADLGKFSIAAFVSTDYISWQEVVGTDTPQEASNNASSNYIIASNEPNASKGRAALPKIIWVVTATAYSSTKDQTDSTPFITASGAHVRDGVVAANFLPFGTMVKMPELFGDKIFVVEDRMNQRYQTGRIDVWFPDRGMAKEFGIKKVKIEIIS